MKQRTHSAAVSTEYNHRIHCSEYETTDYGLFSFYKGNRPICRKRVERKKASIRKAGQLTPILITKNFVILEGQHRFMACCELGIPVIYKFIDGTAKQAIIEANIADPWKLTNYIDINQGDSASLTAYKAIMTKYGFKSSQVNSLLTGSDGNGTFRAEIEGEGDLSVPLEVFSQVELYLPMLFDVQNVRNGIYRSTFRSGKMMGVLMSAFLSDDYDHQYFLGRLLLAPAGSIISGNKRPQIKHMIENVYNATYNESERRRLKKNGPFRIDLDRSLTSLAKNTNKKETVQ